ncbi:MAG: hypothetical protein PHW93_02540 [Candidatus Methanomethylophilaceae archaeon]|nr:hypothetical protein [Candidatus Methanomethylophilaceae archaeon]
MDELKKKDVKLGLLGGLASGLLLFLALYAISGNIYTAAFIPVAVAMGGAQAYMSPRRR